MHPKKLSEKLVKGIKKFFLKAKIKKVVLGLSGGIDSALCAVLLIKALGPKNVTAIFMPVRGVSSDESLKDAKKLSRSLGIKFITIYLNQFSNPFEKLSWRQSKRARLNLFARLRAVILYNYANSHNVIVCGAGNKTEFLLGYFTKFGDGAADIFPIGELYKTNVRELAVHLNLPQEILKKEPSAELWKGQTDEGEIGVKYEEIDRILQLAVEKKKSKLQISKLGHSQKNVRIVLSLFEKNRHKLEFPPVVKI